MTNNSVKSAVRTLKILEYFESAVASVSLGELSSNLSIPKSSAHTLVYTLIEEGYLEKLSHNSFVLNSNLKRSVGWVGGLDGAIRRAAKKEMDRLLVLFEESVVLGVPTDSYDVKITDFRQSSQLMSYSVTNLPTIPGWCTSLGHAILSRIPEDESFKYIDAVSKVALTPKTLTSTSEIMERLRICRHRGYSLSVNERFEGASGVAVPIIDGSGLPRAALNMVMLTPRFFKRKDIIIQEVKRSAKTIEDLLFKRQENNNISQFSVR